MESGTYVVIQSTRQSMYKDIYFPSTNKITSNTLNFIMQENKKKPGLVTIRKYDDYIKNNCVLYRGTQPLDYYHLRRRFSRFPILTKKQKNGFYLDSLIDDIDDNELPFVTK